MFRPASQAALNTVVATWDVPPPTSSSYSVPMITGAGRSRARPSASIASLSERAARRDERVVEQLDPEPQVRDPVGRPRVEGLVRRHPRSIPIASASAVVRSGCSVTTARRATRFALDVAARSSALADAGTFSVVPDRAGTTRMLSPETANPASRAGLLTRSSSAAK